MSLLQEQSALTELLPDTDIEQPPVMPAGEVVIGTLKAINDSGKPMVNYTAFSQAYDHVDSISTLGVLPKHIGKQVSLLFVDGDIQQPIIIGFIHNSLEALLESYDAQAVSIQAVNNEAGDAQNQLLLDGERLNLEAKEEITLKCGDSSISLNKSGKIVIRGKYILNRASGVNRILGGSVQVN